MSGAVAERVKLHSYMIFAMTNAIAYSIPAHWIWTSDGFLNKMGVVDIAGSGTIQLAISFKAEELVMSYIEHTALVRRFSTF